MESDILEPIRYIGSSQSRSVCMGLDHAIYNWSVGYCSEGHGGCFVELYSEYITSKLFSLLVMDGGITHKALQALESINTFGIFKGISSANIYAHIPVHVEYLLYNAIELIEIKHASMSIALIFVFVACYILHTLLCFMGFFVCLCIWFKMTSLVITTSLLWGSGAMGTNIGNIAMSYVM